MLERAISCGCGKACVEYLFHFLLITVYDDGVVVRRILLKEFNVVNFLAYPSQADNEHKFHLKRSITKFVDRIFNSVSTFSS